jgi:hypothetical protein
LLIVPRAIYFTVSHNLNAVYTELELEESMSELMTCQKVHGGGDLVWEMEGRKLNFKLYMTCAYRSTCYFTPLNTVHAELELEESVSELMTGHEVHEGGNLVSEMEGKKFKFSIVHDICLSFHLLFRSTKHNLRRA